MPKVFGFFSENILVWGFEERKSGKLENLGVLPKNLLYMSANSSKSLKVGWGLEVFGDHIFNRTY